MDRIWTYAATAVLPLVWATASLAQSQGDWSRWGHPAWGWGHMMFGGVMMLIFWGGIILLVFLLVRWLSGAGRSDEGDTIPRATPLDILKERFAKGEIDKKEYEERKKILSE